MRRIIIVFFLLYFSQQNIFAQDTLPKITVSNISNNILVSWTNPFSSLTTINIQRSADSNKNFKTIGSVLNVKAKNNGFVDAKPKFDSMYYRIFLSFEGGTYLFTKSKRPAKDTVKIIPDVKNFKETVVNTWFVPSKLVYTGKDNNLIISLPDAGKKKYVVKFFEENGSPFFEITKIAEPYLTLEKSNFIHAGIFNFEVYEEGKLIEKHKFYISKDGRIPSDFSEQGKMQVR